MNNFWQNLQKPFFILAPMEDVTDTVFRQIVLQNGRPDVFFTEFTNVDGMLHKKGLKHVRQRLEYTENERPLVAQIWGNNPESFFKAAQMIVDLKFDAVDINMGCPEKGVVKKCSGGGMIKDPQLAAEVIQAVKEGVREAGRKYQISPTSPRLRRASNIQYPIPKNPPPSPSEGGEQIASSPPREGKHEGQGRVESTTKNVIPVSVKTRIGLNKIDTENWIGHLLQQDIVALTIHGRTVKEQSEVPAHWDEIGKGVKIRDELKLKTLIIGNGDVQSREQGLEYVAKYNVDGIMVGRGIFHNPWIFNKSKKLEDVSIKERLDTFVKHMQLYDKTWGKNKNFEAMKKFCKAYIRDFDGAGELRAQLMLHHDSTAMVQAITQYIDSHTQ